MRKMYDAVVLCLGLGLPAADAESSARNGFGVWGRAGVGEFRWVLQRFGDRVQGLEIWWFCVAGLGASMYLFP